ncbi:MAG: hypothetical protein HYV63_32165 [Candidatus Schekmanbacteria bacterium]|nr:hypothetical protein [Candidatus Schekmanbacteria bacterium]
MFPSLTGVQAGQILRSLCVDFRNVLAASRPVVWPNGRIAAVIAPQKRMSSGFLHLRVAMLNLTPLANGHRKGISPHELLTGERGGDWLDELGYSPRAQRIQTFKRLGWLHMTAPFAPTWRRN